MAQKWKLVILVLIEVNGVWNNLFKSRNTVHITLFLDFMTPMWKAVIEYTKELQKQNKSSKPKALRDLKVNRISGSDTYKITSLGREFLGLMKPVEIDVS